jgi:penicillin-binding protein 1C
MLEPKERTYWNKLIEMFQALQLEAKFSKDEILELYLSMVPLGGNIEGLQSAAMLYYQKPLERLNIARLIDLILIPNDPNGLRPDRHPDALYAERLRRASEWIKEGLLGKEDSVIVWQTPATAERVQPDDRAPHYALRVKAMMGNATEAVGTLDLRMQRAVEKLLTAHLRPWKAQGVKNAAVIVLANRSREVLAYVGSADFGDSLAFGQVDAIRALRSPGSTLKPFLFAHLMDKGLLTPKTVLVDTPFDAEGFYAENYDGTYSGAVYAGVALRRSLNVPMIRLLQEVNVGQFVDHLENLGMLSFVRQKEKLGLSMIVGGCGTTLEELTTAYATFANWGKFQRPVFVLSSGTSGIGERTVYSPSTAYMITEILSGLDRPDLPNNFESSINLPAVAYKTGTSYGRRDAWSVGYSAELTVGVWIGNSDSRGSPELVGSKAAAPLLFDIFNSFSSNHQKTILAAPSDIAVREVCAKSGDLPTPRCTQRIFDLYSMSQTIPRFCEIDKEYYLTRDGTSHFCASCLGNHSYKLASFAEYPSELLSFWMSIGRRYRKPPPHFSGCSRLFAGTGPKILSPSAGMVYYQTSQNQKLALRATSGVDITQHFWYVNNAFLGRKHAGEKIFFTMKEGQQVITCADDKGRASTVTITVRKM